MSLLSRVWLTVALAIILALGGSFVLNVLTARDYLAQQLFAQASDSASSLALSLSQQGKDPAMQELLVSAIFDSGHFESIRYRDVTGTVVVERQSAVAVERVPVWFVQWVPLESVPGEAQVSDGWKQAGTVQVKASARFAYLSLWNGVLRLAVMLLLIGVLLGSLLTLLMRWASSPLRAVVGQAEAIGQRRFVKLPELAVPELRLVGRAMNTMVERVQAMFFEQTARINALRDEANHDAMTLLPNRNLFVAHLKGVLQDEYHADEGGVLVLRLLDLAGVNRRLGRERADGLIIAAAGMLRDMSGDNTELFTGRLNGADFAVIVEDADQERLHALGAFMLNAMSALYRQGMTDREQAVAIGVTHYHKGESGGAVLLRADGALMQAETMGPAMVLALGQGRQHTPQLAEEWRIEINEALARRAFELAGYPTVRADGSLLHNEVMLRMRNRRGETLSAGQFMPSVMRQQRTAEVDLVAIELALAQAACEQGDVAVNLSPLSFSDADFLRELAVVLKANAPHVKRLWVEVSEQGLDADGGLAALTELARLLGSHGGHLGIEHFGRHFSALPQLYSIQLDYIKLDGAFIAGIDQHPGNQRFVKAVIDVARSMSIAVIAERVSSRAEWDMLVLLGIDGMTGPAVSVARQS
ncbi:MAG: EAL domain-containing protein [Uliginosibacterium sp.]|jgi:EAL domain-containing protein (putative c-di-GMP-specific phosphodiesterase class I)/GGDEF domain-containing protein|nr:EAL domain-containing protein [Uliginosibacterium sp.]